MAFVDAPAIPLGAPADGAAGRPQGDHRPGRYGSVRELALDVGVDNSYLARLLRLTLLAPDIIEAIIDGTEPDGLSLERLYGAPMVWEEQRQLLSYWSA